MTAAVDTYSTTTTGPAAAAAAAQQQQYPEDPDVLTELRALLGDALEVAVVLRSVPQPMFDTDTAQPLIERIIKALKRARRLVKLRNQRLASLGAPIGPAQTAFVHQRLDLIIEALQELLASPSLDTVDERTIQLLRTQADAIEGSMVRLLRVLSHATDKNAGLLAQLSDSSYDSRSYLARDGPLTEDVLAILRSMLNDRRLLPNTELALTRAPLHFEDQVVAPDKEYPEGTTPTHQELHLFRFVIDDQGTIVQSTLPTVRIDNSELPWQILPRPGTRRQPLEKLIEAFGQQLGLILPTLGTPSSSSTRVYPTGADQLLVVNDTQVRLAMLIEGQPRLFSTGLRDAFSSPPAFAYRSGAPDPITISGSSSGSLPLVHVLSANLGRDQATFPRQLCTYAIKPLRDSLSFLLLSALPLPADANWVVASGRMLAVARSVPRAPRSLDTGAAGLGLDGGLFNVLPERLIVNVYKQPLARDLLTARMNKKVGTPEFNYEPQGGITMNLTDVAPDCRLADLLVDDDGHLGMLLRFRKSALGEEEMPPPPPPPPSALTSSGPTVEYAQVHRFDLDQSTMQQLFELKWPTNQGATHPRDLVLGPHGQLILSMIRPKTSRANEANMFLVELSPVTRDHDYTVWDDAKITRRLSDDRLRNTTSSADVRLMPQCRVKPLGDSILLGSSYTRQMHTAVDKLLTTLTDLMASTPSGQNAMAHLESATQALRMVASVAGNIKLRDYAVPSREDSHIVELREVLRKKAPAQVTDMFEALVRPLRQQALDALARLTTATGNASTYNFNSDWPLQMQDGLQRVRVLLTAIWYDAR